MKHPFSALLCSLALFPALGYAADLILEVIPLKHRLAEEIIPIVQPLVAPGGTVTGMNDQLIVKTTPENLEDIRAVLDSLDQAPRRLLISVRQEENAARALREQAVSGRVTEGGVSVEYPDPGHGGLGLGAGDERDDHIRYRVQHSRSVEDDRNIFRVQAVEGQPALIQIGQSVPIPTQTQVIIPVIQGSVEVQEGNQYQETQVIIPGGVMVQEDTQYQEAISGFYVLPRISGDRVTLELAPRMMRVRSAGGFPVFELEDMITTVSGRLGEWIVIGGVDQYLSDSDRRTLTYATGGSRSTRTILLKVEELP